MSKTLQKKASKSVNERLKSLLAIHSAIHIPRPYTSGSAIASELCSHLTAEKVFFSDSPAVQIAILGFLLTENTQMVLFFFLLLLLFFFESAALVGIRAQPKKEKWQSYHDHNCLKWVLLLCHAQKFRASWSIDVGVSVSNPCKVIPLSDEVGLWDMIKKVKQKDKFAHEIGGKFMETTCNRLADLHGRSLAVLVQRSFKTRDLSGAVAYILRHSTMYTTIIDRQDTCWARFAWKDARPPLFFPTTKWRKNHWIAWQCTFKMSALAVSCRKVAGDDRESSPQSCWICVFKSDWFDMNGWFITLSFYLSQ